MSETYGTQILRRHSKICMGHVTWRVPLILLIFLMRTCQGHVRDTFETWRGTFYNLIKLFRGSKLPLIPIPRAPIESPLSMGRERSFYSYKLPSFIKEKPTILSRIDYDVGYSGRQMWLLWWWCIYKYIYKKYIKIFFCRVPVVSVSWFFENCHILCPYPCLCSYLYPCFLVYN